MIKVDGKNILILVVASSGLTVFGGVSNTPSPAYTRVRSTVADLIMPVRRWPATAASGRLGAGTCGDGAGDKAYIHRLKVKYGSILQDDEKLG